MGLHPYVVDDLKAGRLVAPFALQVKKPMGWFLVHRPDAENLPAFETFRKWIKAEARADLPGAG
jgi:LysR family glycine cleavage system transcriptional activator